MSVVEKIDWRRSAPQIWHDDWRGTDRTCRFKGACVLCGIRTFAFDDGQNDPRGILGDHAASPKRARDYDDPSGEPYEGDDVPCCFSCANDYDRSRMVERIAFERWRSPDYDETTDG